MIVHVRVSSAMTDGRPVASESTYVPLPPSVRVWSKQVTLPGDVLLRVFQIIADDVCVGGYQWWKREQWCQFAIFRELARVCRQWYQIANRFRRPAFVPVIKLCTMCPHDKSYKWLTHSKDLVIPYDRRTSEDLLWGPTLPKLPGDILEYTTHITSLRARLEHYSHPNLSSFLKELSSRVSRLSIDAFAQSRHLDFDYLALGLHQNRSLKELAIYGARIVYSAEHASSPLLCESVYMSNVLCITDVELASIFPKASSVLYHLNKRQTAAGLCGLNLSKPSHALTQLDIECDTKTAAYLSLQRDEFGILSSPNLRFLRLQMNASDGAAGPNVTTKLTLPGYSMPQLESLEITIDGENPCVMSLLNICRQFADPAFCPRITQLPLLRLGRRSTERGRHAESIIRNESSTIRKVLASLKCRGLTFRSQDVDGTIWEMGDDLDTVWVYEYDDDAPTAE